MIDTILLDLDDTILDFHKSEAFALKKTLEELGIEPLTKELPVLISQNILKIFLFLRELDITSLK